MRRALPLLPAGLFLAVFFVMPLIDVIRRSVTGRGGALTFVRYGRLLTERYYLGVLGQTLALSAGVTVLCILIGYPVAYYLVRHGGRWSGVIVFALVGPLLTSIIMRTFGWQVLFAHGGIVNGSILVFMVANGSFVTLLLLGGGLQTLPLLIYQQFNTTRDFGLASAMSTVLLAIALVCLWLQLMLLRRHARAA